MKIEHNSTYPRPIKASSLKESYKVVKHYHRKETYNMSQKEYRKMLFAGVGTMKEIMRIFECPKESEICIIDGGPDGTKGWNRHLVAERFFTGKKYRLGIWVYSSGEFNLVIKDLSTGDSTYQRKFATNTKEMIHLAREIKREYMK